MGGMWQIEFSSNAKEDTNFIIFYCFDALNSNAALSIHSIDLPFTASSWTNLWAGLVSCVALEAVMHVLEYSGL